jgi:hypothetical protein
MFANDLKLATVQKLISEMMPGDIVCAKDTRDLLIDCCVGKESRLFFELVSSSYALVVHCKLCSKLM